MQSFDDWYMILSDLASSHGESVADYEAWVGSYEDGESAEEAFYDEYPEHRPATQTP